MIAPPLFHFTCSHGREHIGVEGLLVAQVTHPLLGCRVSWMTTERRPDREATGLTQTIVKCDRMAHRYSVSDPSDCRDWLHSYERLLARGWAVAELERWHDPEHWWIATKPVPVVLDL